LIKIIYESGVGELFSLEVFLKRNASKPLLFYFN